MKIWRQLSNILPLAPRCTANEHLSGASLPEDAALLESRLLGWAVAEGSWQMREMVAGPREGD